MTVLVLGIAMFLPLGLYVTLTNLESMNLRQDEWSAVTVYFETGTSQSEVEQISNDIKERLQPKAVNLISPEQGMAEFRQASGFGESLEILQENPLPWVMQISPHSGDTGKIEERVKVLTTHLQTIDGIELIQFDHKWLQRLGRMM